MLLGAYRRRNLLWWSDERSEWFLSWKWAPFIQFRLIIDCMRKPISIWRMRFMTVFFEHPIIYEKRLFASCLVLNELYIYLDHKFLHSQLLHAIYSKYTEIERGKFIFKTFKIKLHIAMDLFKGNMNISNWKLMAMGLSHFGLNYSLILFFRTDLHELILVIYFRYRIFSCLLLRQ